MRQSVGVTILSRPESLSEVRSLVRRLTDRAGFSERECNRVAVAICEALANIIQHCYAWDRDQRIELTFSCGGDRFETKIRDFGDKADPSCFCARDPLDLREGGLGLYFMRAIMDEVTFDTSCEVGTVLSMVKYRGSQ